MSNPAGLPLAADSAPTLVQAPLPVVEIKVTTDAGPEGEPLLLVTAGRKSHVLRCETVGDRHGWITALQSQRELAIKQQLGHAEVPDDEEALNKVTGLPGPLRLVNTTHGTLEPSPAHAIF